MPNLSALGDIKHHDQRLRESVSELCRIHEAMFGYAWLSEHQRKDSPTLDAEMIGYEGLTDAIVEIVTPPGFTKAPLVRGLLDFLSYRALRLSGKLPPEEVTEELINMINLLMTGSTKSAT